VRRVRKLVKSNSLTLLIVMLEFKRVVSVIAVNNKQLISAYNLPLCMLIKVL
jgi:hypothetical protein